MKKLLFDVAEINNGLKEIKEKSRIVQKLPNTSHINPTLTDLFGYKKGGKDEKRA